MPKKQYRSYKNIERKCRKAHTQWSYTNIWSAIKYCQDKEARFKHVLLEINVGAQGRPKTATTIAIQQRINTLNERFTSKEINPKELLDGLTLTDRQQVSWLFLYSL